MEYITCTLPGHVPGCPGASGGDHEFTAWEDTFKRIAQERRWALAIEDAKDDASFAPESIQRALAGDR